MKRIIYITLPLILLLLTVTTTSSLGQSTSHIKVQKELKPYFNELIEIVEKNDLDVDWGKVDAIILSPLSRGIQGYWSQDGSTIMINYLFIFPSFVELTNDEKDDFILLTLAHEVGHSQGLKHIATDKIGLMSPHSKFELGIIRGSIGAEQFIVNTFKELSKN